MYKFLFAISLFLLTTQAYAQYGISAGYVKFSAPEFDKAYEDLAGLTNASKTYDQGTYQVAIDYWFRLKEKRVEFMPEISYLKAKALIASEVGIDEAFSNDLAMDVIQFNFNANIYPFDFAGDCNCPTFSKQGDFLQKGFFVRLAPGVSFNNFTNQRSEVSIIGSSTESLQDLGIGLNLRAGIGLDIGVSDFITVTPIAQYTYTSKSEYIQAYQNPAHTVNQKKSSLQQLFIGLRLGFRFDELNKYGYR